MCIYNVYIMYIIYIYIYTQYICIYNLHISLSIYTYHQCLLFCQIKITSPKTASHALKDLRCAKSSWRPRPHGLPLEVAKKQWN